MPKVRTESPHRYLGVGMGRIAGDFRSLLFIIDVLTYDVTMPHSLVNVLIKFCSALEKHVVHFSSKVVGLMAG